MLFNELNINRHTAFKYLPVAFGVQMNMFINDSYKSRNHWLKRCRHQPRGCGVKMGQNTSKNYHKPLKIKQIHQLG